MVIFFWIIKLNVPSFAVPREGWGTKKSQKKEKMDVKSNKRDFGDSSRLKKRGKRKRLVFIEEGGEEGEGTN